MLISLFLSILLLRYFHGYSKLISTFRYNRNVFFIFLKYKFIKDDIVKRYKHESECYYIIVLYAINIRYSNIMFLHMLIGVTEIFNKKINT